MIRFISVCLRVTNIYSVFKSYIYNEHLSIPGAPKKSLIYSTFAKLSVEEKETNNAEIPQVARFRPRVCRTPAHRGSCVVGSEETYEDEEVPAGFKEETLTTASRFGNNGAGARHQGMSQGLSKPFSRSPERISGKTEQSPQRRNVRRESSSNARIAPNSRGVFTRR